MSPERAPTPGDEFRRGGYPLSERDKHLCCSSLVHRLVALGCLLERERQVEDLAGVDLAVQDELDQLRQEATNGGWAAKQVHLGEEELEAVNRDAVADTDEADVSSGPRGVDRLHHRLLRADRFDHGVRAEAVGELLYAGAPFVAAFFDDVGRSVEARELLPFRVARHSDDPLSTELLRGENSHQADRAVADDRHGLARADLGGDGGEPPGAENV